MDMLLGSLYVLKIANFSCNEAHLPSLITFHVAHWQTNGLPCYSCTTARRSLVTLQLPKGEVGMKERADYSYEAVIRRHSKGMPSSTT